MKGNDAPKTTETKLARISNDPRYQFYLVLSKIQGIEALDPRGFLS